jgi:transcriptional regulator with XRE-family HTH domain
VQVDPQLLALGQEVRRRRKAAGLSQEELAALSEMHPNYIGGIERGERNVGVKAFLRLAEGLGIEPGELFAPFSKPNLCRP